MNEQKTAAKQLRDKYAQELAQRGGDLDVRGFKGRLSAAVTWREPNIYDHIDIEDRNIPEASALVEKQIQEWIREGPPTA